MNFEWKGVFPALLTPFTANDEIDLPLFETNLRAQLEAGVEGIILGGTLGEASVLSTAEKETLVKFALEKVNGKVPVIINIAEGSTREALQQASYGKAWQCPKSGYKQRKLLQKLFAINFRFFSNNFIFAFLKL